MQERARGIASRTMGMEWVKGMTIVTVIMTAGYMSIHRMARR